jgi:hypothetical protein
VAGAIVIQRAIEEVFDYITVADASHESAYNPRMTRAEKVSAGW